MKVNENQSFLLILDKSRATYHGSKPIYAYQFVNGKRVKVNLQLKIVVFLSYPGCGGAKPSLAILNQLIKKKPKCQVMDGTVFPFLKHQSPEITKAYLRGTFNHKSPGYESK